MVPAPVGLVTHPTVRIDVHLVTARRSADGLHARVPGGAQLTFLGDGAFDRPLAAVIPLDGMARDRLGAIERFLRSQGGRRVFDTRLTQTQRRRLAQMLRALDGRREGASYLELALALFGRRLVDPANWQDSSFRYTTLRLVRDGLRTVDRGYRQLLRARRSPDADL